MFSKFVLAQWFRKLADRLDGTHKMLEAIRQMDAVNVQVLRRYNKELTDRSRQLAKKGL